MPHSNPLKLQHAASPESHFADVDLSRSVFSDVSLRGASFENVALTGASFRNACFGDVAIADANLEGFRINGVLVTELLRVYAESPLR
jgi:uncharacterized protein YjbI with pentapeptide repeats